MRSLVTLTLLVPFAACAQAQTWGETSTYVSVSTIHLNYYSLVEMDDNGFQSWVPGQSQGASASTASGRAEGSASAMDGTLHSYAKTTLTGDSVDGHQVNATTHAAFQQMVTLTNSDADELDLPMAVSLDGDWSGLARGSAYFQIKTGPGQLAFSLMAYSGEGEGTQLYDTNVLTLPPHSSTTIAVDGYLDAYADSDADHRLSLADYSHTAHFLWDLPQGVTATGIGGAFNPGSIQAVPEPAPLAALALGGIAVLRRRAKRA